MRVPQVEMAPNGPEFSKLVSGMMNLASWQWSTTQLIEWLEKCLLAGITTFDHADIYGSYSCEGIFGQALAKAAHLRSQMQLVSKCDIMLLSEKMPQTYVKHYDASKGHIISSVNRSLRELQTNYLDVLLLHRPDPLMNVDEVAEAFNLLKQDGKVLYFGVSNFSVSTYQLLQSRLDFPLVTNQIELSVLQTKALHDGTLDLCQQWRIRPMIWSPFAGGRVFTGTDEQATRTRAVMEKIGEEIGASGIDQVALAWLLMHPAQLVPILGTGNWERMQTAVEALDLFMTRQHWFAIWQASMGHDIP